MVANNYDLKEVNFGMGGAGNHQIARQLFQDMFNYKRRKVNPLVVVVYSDPNRLELYSNKRAKSINLSTDFSFYKDFLVESFNIKHNQNCTHFYIDCIRSILNVLNFDYIEANSITPVILSRSHFSNQTYMLKYLSEIAGDQGSFKIINESNKILNGHPNILGHQLIAQEIIAKIDELYGTN